MTSVFLVWGVANMAALGVWLAARKRHALNLLDCYYCTALRGISIKN